jgi:hypothetical protein
MADDYTIEEAYEDFIYYVSEDNEEWLESEDDVVMIRRLLRSPNNFKNLLTALDIQELARIVRTLERFSEALIAFDVPEFSIKKTLQFKRQLGRVTALVREVLAEAQQQNGGRRRKRSTRRSGRNQRGRRSTRK